MVVNDGPEKHIKYAVRDADGGEILLEGEVTAIGDSVTELGTIPADEGKRFLLMEWETADGKFVNHYFTNALDIDMIIV